MKITSSLAVDGNNQGFQKKIPLKKGVILLLILLAILGLSLITYHITTKYFPLGIKIFIYRSLSARGHDYFQEIPIRETAMKIPRRILADVEMPKLYIDIKFKHIQKIHAKRNQALERGILIQGKDDFIPAEIRLSDRHTVKVKMRLKGDWTDHLEGDKWSFRIHTKGKGHLFGMRRFSIQHPATRGYQGEVLFHETVRRLGGLAPKYLFVNVVINGKDIGVMAVEEHFSKELLERNGRKEGVIVRFDESIVWDAKDGAVINGRSHGFLGAFDSYLNAPIDAFQSSKIKKSVRLQSEYEIAVGLLRGFADGTLKPSDVFDYIQMGQFIAIVEYFGCSHAVHWHNLRFYLNPLTMKLEPIAYDGNLGELSEKGLSVVKKEPMISKILKDKNIDAVFRQTLKRLSEETQNGTLISWLKKVEEPHLKRLQKEFYLLASFNYEALKERALSEHQAQVVDPSVYPLYVHATRIEKDNNSYLEISNAIPHIVEVGSLAWVDKNENRIPIQGKNIIFPIELSKTDLHDFPQIHRIDYKPLPKDNREFILEVHANIKGNSLSKRHVAHLGFPTLSTLPLPTSTMAEQLEKHPFLRVNENEKIIDFKKGSWQVKGSIVLPKGYEIHIPAGTQLAFDKDSSFIIYGRANFLGTKDAPILLRGQDDESNTWGGFALYEAEKRSKWSHVQVFNTTGVSWPSWGLTGGVSFYKSDVDLNHCLFKGSKGEDALNIIHSDFKLQEITIMETISDAFDGDFTTGTVSGGMFQDIGLAGGGDGVDISGSTISVDGVYFNRVRDKALSVGEGSTMTATNITIEKSSIGAASKDGSLLTINKSTINESGNYALMVYLKKPEYGSSTIKANDIKILDTKIHTQVQQGCTLELNGELIEAEDVNVKKMYKTIMKPGIDK